MYYILKTLEDGQVYLFEGVEDLLEEFFDNADATRALALTLLELNGREGIKKWRDMSQPEDNFTLIATKEWRNSRPLASQEWIDLREYWKAKIDQPDKRSVMGTVWDYWGGRTLVVVTYSTGMVEALVYDNTNTLAPLEEFSTARQ